MSINLARKPVEILLVDDNPGDVRLVQEALADSPIPNLLSVVQDGAEAMDLLRRQGRFAHAPRPRLILLDLNLPRKDGREVLADIKRDPNLRRIPVIVLTTSQAEQDVVNVYDLQANCYITKPVGWDQFAAVLKAIRDFWLTVAKLPPNEVR